MHWLSVIYEVYCRKSDVKVRPVRKDGVTLNNGGMKRILVLKACGSSDEPHECNGICDQAQLYGIEAVCKGVNTYGMSKHWSL